jgi:hypothetical protein
VVRLHYWQDYSGSLPSFPFSYKCTSMSWNIEIIFYGKINYLYNIHVIIYVYKIKPKINTEQNLCTFINSASSFLHFHYFIIVECLSLQFFSCDGYFLEMVHYSKTYLN